MKKSFFNLLIISFLVFIINACKDDPSPEKKIIPDSCAVLVETVKDKIGFITKNDYNTNKEWMIRIMETFPSCHWRDFQICGELPDSLKQWKDWILKIDGEMRASKIGINPQNFTITKAVIHEEFSPKQFIPMAMVESNTAKLGKSLYLITSEEAYLTFKAETGYSTPHPIDFDKFTLIGYQIKYSGCCGPIRKIVKEFPANNHVAIEVVIIDESFCRLLTIEEGWYLMPKYNPNTTFTIEVIKNITQ